MKVFVGDVNDVTVLVSLLNSGGIETNVLRSPSHSDPHVQGGTTIYVRQADAADALDLIADFQSNRQ
ncbi:MAG TPA: hypothetical protein VFD69_16890 [Vicinamibacterales bacterium]|nr:hypothetical protein [Vicinamibacterales bacterium]